MSEDAARWVAVNPAYGGIRVQPRELFLSEDVASWVAVNPAYGGIRVCPREFFYLAGHNLCRWLLIPPMAGFESVRGSFFI